MTKKFQKKVEDFECFHCETKVEGTGFTNHCPNCLWSKHVDINPGDRENDCGGQMKPINSFFEKGKWKIVHQCQRCFSLTNTFATEADNLDEITKLSTASLK